RAYNRVSHRLRDRQQLYFAGAFRLVIDAIWRAEKRGFHAQVTFQEEFREVQLNLKLRLGKAIDVKLWMREGVIADLISQGVFALHDTVFLIGRFSDYEECSGCVFLLQNIQNFGSPIRVGAIIKTERHLVQGGAHLLNAPRIRIALETFIVEGIRIGVVLKSSATALWRRRDAPDIAGAFQDQVVAGRNLLQFLPGGIIGVSGIPNIPDGRIFHAQPP